jgi:hypothetical protein
MTRLTLAAQCFAGGILMLSWVIVPAVVLWSVE